VDRDDYDAIEAMNWSSLKLLHTSPLYYRHRLAEPQPEKRHFVQGTADHCAVLEPEFLEQRFGVYDGTHDKRHNAYKEWVAEHTGLKPLKQKEMDQALGIREAVHRNRDAHRLLTGGRAEETITWLDPSGIKCKARLDYVRPNAVVELKSTRDIGQREFVKQACQLLYHGQAAWYHYGAIEARAIITESEYPYVIAVEKEPPYDCGVYHLTPEWIEAGAELVRSLLKKYSDCMAADWWPGKVPAIAYPGLPSWAARGEEQEAFE
jgi:exodeoxyribonuclease VIII